MDRSIQYIFCGKCEFLSLTEEEQNRSENKLKDHVCIKYKKRVTHNEYHPHICRLSICIKDNQIRD
jgi:myo-inositol-1-phosphate synthase